MEGQEHDARCKEAQTIGSRQETTSHMHCATYKMQQQTNDLQYGAIYNYAAQIEKRKLNTHCIVDCISCIASLVKHPRGSVSNYNTLLFSQCAIVFNTYSLLPLTSCCSELKPLSLLSFVYQALRKTLSLDRQSRANSIKYRLSKHVVIQPPPTHPRLLPPKAAPRFAPKFAPEFAP